MSTPSPIRLELADPAAYIKRQTGLVGDRDPMEVLTATSGEIDRLISGQRSATLQKRPFEGKWTPTEVIGHLMDVEWTYGFRCRMILAHDAPALAGMDQDLWVAAQRYNERPAPELATAFRTLRSVNLVFWRSLMDSDLDRFGVHAERGNESLRHIRSLLAGHDLWHLDQLRRYIDAAKSLA